MTVAEIVSAVGPAATLISSLAALLSAIIAAVKAARAESSSKQAAATAVEIRTVLTQVLIQRQHQQVNVNLVTGEKLVTGGNFKGGKTIDVSEEPEEPPALP